MKKIIVVCLAIILLLSMTACSAKDDGKFVIGICQLQEHPALSAATKGFMDAVKEGMAAEGLEVEFDVQIASGEATTCTNILLDFVSSEVDLILANATAALQAAAAVTEDIPILGTSITEYSVALGLKDYNGTVGGNISGTSDLAPLDEQAAMIKEWFPDAKNVGLLYCAAEPNSKYQVDVVETELTKLGFTCKQYAFSSTSDLDPVTRKAASESDVIYVPTDNTVAEAAGVVDGICRPAGIPVIAGEQGICSGCGVATLSIDYYDLGAATGRMAVKILTGKASISTMAIEYAPEFKKLYNAEICKELDITVPAGYEPIV